MNYLILILSALLVSAPSLANLNCEGQDPTWVKWK